MKKMKYIPALILTVLLAAQTGYAQFPSGRIYLDFNSDLIEGVWEATAGDMTYTLTIRRGFASGELPEGREPVYFEKLLGAVKYQKNGQVVRNTKIDGYGSFLVSQARDRHMRVSSRYEVYFSLNDMEREIAGFVTFTLDPADPKKARWSLELDTFSKYFYDWTEDTFDIPLTLQFRQIEGVPPRDSGGGFASGSSIF